MNRPDEAAQNNSQEEKDTNLEIMSMRAIIKMPNTSITANSLRLFVNQLADKNDHEIKLDLNNEWELEMVRRYFKNNLPQEYAIPLIEAIEIRKRANQREENIDQ